MIEITQVNASLDEAGDENACLIFGKRVAKRILCCKDSEIESIELHRKSIDARKKRDVHFILSFRVELTSPHLEREAVDSVAERDRSRVRAIEDDEPSFPSPVSDAPQERPVVVGAGCAGLFAALTLAKAGLKPLLIERGDPAFRRSQAIDLFLKERILDPESNIQFGLGGAGTFSDGKLNTGTKNPAHRLILETFVEAGAPRDILWDAKPHIGSDILPKVVTAISQRIEQLGGVVRYRTKLVDIRIDASGAIIGIDVQSSQDAAYEPIETKHLILACGHSARDIFELLKDHNVALAQKTFAMGVRIEHPQRDIDRAQYGASAGHPALGAAPYKLVAHLPNGRSVFSLLHVTPADRLLPPLQNRSICASTGPVSMPATDATQMPPCSLTSRLRTFPTMTRSPASSSSVPARRPPIAWAVPTGTHRHNSSEISSQDAPARRPER